jgi:hypothetical protein
MLNNKHGRAYKIFSCKEKKNQFRGVASFSSPFSVFVSPLPPRPAPHRATSPPPHQAAAMHKTAQAWFTGGTAASPAASGESQPSLLADWNSYAATRSDASSSSPLPFDIEAAVRSANDTVSGTFSS